MWIIYLKRHALMMLTYLCLYKSFKSITPSKSPTSLVADTAVLASTPNTGSGDTKQPEVSETELLLTVDHYWWSYDWLHDQTHYMALSLVNILSQQCSILDRAFPNMKASACNLIICARTLKLGNFLREDRNLN